MAVCMRVWYGAPATRCYTARMQRPLGNLGLSVAPIGLGGMPLSIQGRPDESTALAVIAAFVEGGGTHIDTAISYCLDDADFGHNERLIAKALRTLRRTDIVVATKGGLTRPSGRWEVDCSPAWLRHCCEQSAARFGRANRALLLAHRRSCSAARGLRRRARAAARRRQDFGVSAYRTSTRANSTKPCA